MTIFFAILSIAASLVSFFMGTMVFLKNPRGRQNIVFLFLCYVLAFWGFTEFHTRIAGSAGDAHTWIHINFFWPFSTALLLHFVLVFTQKQRLLRNPLTYVLLYLPASIIAGGVAFSGSISAPPIHEYWGWTYGSPETAAAKASTAWVSFIGITAAVMGLVYYLRLKNGEKRIQSGYVVLGLAIPVLIGSAADALLPWFGFRVPELAVVSFAIGIAGFIGFAIWKYELFKLTPTTAAVEILDTLSDSLLLIDPACRIITANKAAEELLGYKTSQLLGREVGFIFSNQNDQEECRKLMEDDSVAGAESIDITWRTKHGADVPVSLSLSKYRDKNGRLRGFICVARDISEKIKSEEKLRESETRYRTQFEASPDGILVMDLDGTIRMSNRQVYQTHGFQDMGQIIGRNGAEFLLPEDRERMVRDLTNLLENPGGLGEGPVVEYLLLRADGGYWPASIKGSLIRDADGNPSGFMLIMRDMTELKQTESELIRKDASLMEAQRVAHLGYWELDHVNGKLYWSDEVYRIFGLEPRQFGATYESFLEHVHPDDREAVDSAYKKSLREKTGYEIDHRVTCSDGKVKHVHERCNTEFDGQGNPLRSIGIVLDVTDLKKTELALAESEARYRNLLNLSPDGTAVLDIDGNFQIVNTRALKQLGYDSLEELKNKKIMMIIAPDDQQKASNLFRKALKTGGFINEEFRFIKKDGSSLVAEVSASMIVDENNKPQGIISVSRDISDRKLVEEEIQRMADDISLINLLNNASNRGDDIPGMLGLMDTEVRSMLACNGSGVCIVSEDGKSLELEDFFLPPAKVSLIERMTGTMLDSIALTVDLMSSEVCAGLLENAKITQLGDPEIIKKAMSEFAGNGDAGRISSILRIADIKSVMAVPLITSHGAAAMLIFSRDRPLSETDTRRVQTISEHMAVIIDRKLLYEETRKLSLHDPLTGLANRNLMNLMLDESFARAKRTGVPVSLIMLDLDFFKKFNDSYGHTAGDKLLADIAALLKEEIREVDTAVRYGGEEFLVILPDSEARVAADVAERIRSSVERKEFSGAEIQPPLRMTVSLGVASFGEGATSADALISRADACLYQAKKNGRNRVECWDASMPTA